ncbi:MAG: TolC family protein [Thermoanaerobaculia bacterium]
MRRIAGFSSIVLLVLFFVRPLAGSEAERIEIAALESKARAGSPQLLAARDRASAASALAEAAGVRGDPGLELWVRNALPTLARNVDRPLAVEVEVVQPVRWPGKRGALAALAAAEAKAALFEVDLAEQSVVAEVRKNFAELYSADHEQRVLAEAHDLLELIESTARVRFGAAQESSLPVLEAELASNEHDQSLDLVFSRFLARRAKLAELIGVVPDALPLLVGELPQPGFVNIEGPIPLGATVPKVTAARLRLEIAQRRMEGAALGLKPDFGVGGGFLWPEGGNPELSLKLGVELPFFRRKRLGPAVRAAEGEVAAARAELAGAEAQSRSESVRLGAERDRLERRLARLSGAIVPRTSVALDAARVGFLDGSVEFSRLLDLFNDWFHARVELSSTEAERYAVWAEAQALAGLPFEPPPAESKP